jgi:flagellar hook-associated protein 1 FlgK
VFPDGIRVAGLASTIHVNPAYDPAQGGSAKRVRDAGSAGPAYLANLANASGASDRISSLIAALSSPRSFDPAADLEGDASVLLFATSSVSWLADKTQSTTEAFDYRTAVASRATEALTRETGISLDQEMSRMLELERSYQASARLLTTIDDMYRVLLGIAE